ncbi:hypothetical protein EMIT0P176_10547 [Pseudomonas sp. IT-P176]
MVQRAVAEQPGGRACAVPQRGSSSRLKASRASPLPQDLRLNTLFVNNRDHCGSGLARDEALPFTIFFRYATLILRTVRNMIYCVQSYAARASQPSVNKLPTAPPTANGDNCGKAESFLHRN